MGLVQKSFSDIITFSRSSNATRVGPTGLVEYAPHNLLLQSQTFDNAPYTVAAASVTANAIAAPNGTVTADKLVEDSTNAAHYLFQTPTVATGTYSLSVYMKAAERSFGWLYANTGASATAYFDLANGTVGTVSGTYSPTATITSVGNGWYRCTMTFAATNSNFPCGIGVASANGTNSYTGDGTSGLYIWGVQLAVGPYALDYTPTTSAAVYGPRFDYDGSGVTIVEPVSRNLLTYSEQFDNAAWNMISGTVTANSIAAPDGTITADKYTPSASNAYQLLYQVASTFGTYTFSIYAKAGEYTQAMLWTDKPVAFGTSAFNLSNGTVFQQGTGHTNVSITSVGNGWYRCSITATSTSGTPTFYVGIAPSGNTGGTFAGNGTSGGYLWGAQLEVGSTATGYMVSGATNGFRAVPVVSGSATPNGLLVEEQRTNLLLYSEQFDNAAWFKTSAGSGSNPVVSANYSSSPDGTVNADLVVFSAPGGSDQSFIYQTPSGSGSCTGSFYCKAATASDVGKIILFRHVNAGAYQNITLTSSWQRVTLTEPYSTNNFEIGLRPAISGSSGTVSVLLWGAQLEAGSFATSYIPTLASTVTRSADVASVDTLSPWFNATEGTLFADTTNLVPVSYVGLDNSVVLFDDTTTSNWMGLYRSVSYPSLRYAVVSGGSIQVDLNVLSPYPPTSSKAAFAYKANDFASTADGLSVTTDTSGTVPTITGLRIGGGAWGSAKFNGYIRRIAYYPRRLTNAELQALTA